MLTMLLLWLLSRRRTPSSDQERLLIDEVNRQIVNPRIWAMAGIIVLVVVWRFG